MARRTGPEDFVFTLTTGFPRRIEFYFYMDRSNVDISSLSQLAALRKTHPRALLICNPSSVTGSDRQLLIDLLKKHPADLYDGFLVVDLRSDKPGMREYAFTAQPTGAAYRYFVSHKFPPMKPVPRVSQTLECLYGETRIAVPADLPPLPPLTAPSAESAQCRHELLLLRGERDAADEVVEKLRSMLVREDVPLGPGARVVAARLEARGRSSDLWLRLDEPKSIPGAAGLRLRLRSDNGKTPPLVFEQRVFPPLSSLPPGTLRFERMTVNAPPGRYFVTLELLDHGRPRAAAPPRAPVRPRRPPTLVPPRAAPPVVPPTIPVVATADLGRVEIH